MSDPDQPRPALRRRPVALGAAGVALLLAIATAFLGMRQFAAAPTLAASGAIPQGARVVLAGFVAGGAADATSADPLATAATEALRLALRGTAAIRLVEPSAAEGGAAVLAGELAVRGAGLTLRLRVMTPNGSEVLATLREAARDTAELLDAIDRLAGHLRVELGDGAAAVRSATLSQTATSSVPAFSRYAASLRATVAGGDVALATAHAEAAVALDSTFSLAWRRLGLLLLEQDGRSTEMRQALTRAHELRERMPARDRLLTEALHAHHVIHDEARAVPLYEAVLREAPLDEGALAGLPDALLHQRRFAEIETPLLTAIDGGLASARHWSLLIAAQYAQGRTQDAQLNLERAAAQFRGDPQIQRLEATFAIAEGDWPRALGWTRAAAAAVRAEPARRAALELDLWQIARAQGRLSDAERHLAVADAALARLDLRVARLRARIAQAELTALTRVDRVGAVRQLERAEREFPLAELPVADRPYLRLAEVYAWAGAVERAQELLHEFEAAGIAPAADESPALTRGVIELARGDVLAAVASLRTHVGVGACTICGLGALGHALEAADEPEAALDAYERYLATPYLLRRESDAAWRAFVLGRAAELHQRLGHRDRAVQRYDEFVRLWQHADRELQSQVESARRRIRALRR